MLYTIILYLCSVALNKYILFLNETNKFWNLVRNKKKKLFEIWLGKFYENVCMYIFSDLYVKYCSVVLNFWGWFNVIFIISIRMHRRRIIELNDISSNLIIYFHINTTIIRHKNK